MCCSARSSTVSAAAHFASHFEAQKRSGCIDGQHSLDPMADMFQHEKVVAGFSDAGAHGRGQCEAATPTSLIAFWCRDRSRGDLLPIEMIVKKQTRDSARMMGLTDRGELLPGQKADVNIIDLETLDVLPPEYVNDLPLNAGRWVQASTGYDMTICSGVITFEHGQHTGALPGRLAKNPRATGEFNGLRGSVEPGVADGASSVAAGHDLHHDLAADRIDLEEFAAALQKESLGPSAIMKTNARDNEKAAREKAKM